MPPLPEGVLLPLLCVFLQNHVINQWFPQGISLSPLSPSTITQRGVKPGQNLPGLGAAPRSWGWKGNKEPRTNCWRSSSLSSGLTLSTESSVKSMSLVKIIGFIFYLWVLERKAATRAFLKMIEWLCSRLNTEIFVKESNLIGRVETLKHHFNL